MRSRRLSHSLPASLVLLVCASAIPLLAAACKQPPAAVVVDSGPPPAPTDAAVAQLVPLDEDAGNGLDAAVAPAHHPGGGLSTNQARARQCCNALRAEAKTLGASPEANILTSFAIQCDAAAMQLGPTAGGQAPEFAGLRQMLKGHNMPPVCQGL